MRSLSQRVSDELLPFVERPSQYIGGEMNQLVGPDDWDRAEVRVVVAFPDTYTLGMSHLGCQIIYWLCNHTPGVCAERVFCPWTDAERVMRAKKIPLFTWDTRRPVRQCDILAVSLQYELCFTGLLSLLDLAGIPLRADQRDDRHPLVIAGGPQADNPEPVADFVDLVVLGDGERSMQSVLAKYKELLEAGVRRRDMIPLMAEAFEWMYAPSCYDVTYAPDGTLATIAPKSDRFRPRIERCQTPDFETAPFPVRPLVPYTQVVHDRIAIEIMRGCPQRCRFCHAGYTKRPLRLRTVDRILEIAEEMYASTGSNELGLLSLSTADYPHLRELAGRVNQVFAPRGVNISVPSLRVDRMLANIPFMVNAVRKGGLTLAVEAARDDMRAAIRKKVTDGHLLNGVRAAYQAGWKSVKLYFMVGFPGERETDIDGIVELSRRVSELRREVAGSPARVTASIGWLVPKPFTPLQWATQPVADYFHEVRRRLRSGLKATRSAVRLRTHHIERSVLEAVFARGDRRLGRVIETAWRLGARFDGWDEMFDDRRWQEAFDETGVNVDFYAHRERPFGEIFPWAHLHAGPSDDYLHRQYTDILTRMDARGAASRPAGHVAPRLQASPSG